MNKKCTHTALTDVQLWKQKKFRETHVQFYSKADVQNHILLMIINTFLKFCTKS